MTKKSIFAALLLSTAILIQPAHAARDLRDVVHDDRSNKVLNTFGNCVRTQWVSKSDECGGKAGRRAINIGKEERTIYFEFNKATLTAESRRKLDTLANVLSHDSSVRSASIVGYADRIGSAGFNDKLSQKRAFAVKEYLSKRGYLNTTVADTQWVGETEPVTSCAQTLAKPDLVNCLAKDRRVEVQIDYRSKR